jgi:hypothetical protein
MHTYISPNSMNSMAAAATGQLPYGNPPRSNTQTHQAPPFGAAHGSMSEVGVPTPVLSTAPSLTPSNVMVHQVIPSPSIALPVNTTTASTDMTDHNVVNSNNTFRSAGSVVTVAAHGEVNGTLVPASNVQVPPTSHAYASTNLPVVNIAPTDT